MNADKINTSDLLDILFEGKNKTYGAYELRRNYNKRLYVATALMVLTSLLFFFTQISASHKTRNNPGIPITDLYLKDIEKAREEIPEVPAIKKVNPVSPKAAVTKFTAPLIVKNANEIDQPPAVVELEQTKIGLKTQEGSNNTSDVTAPPLEQGTGEVTLVKKPDEDYTKTFTRVEKEARFPGGMEGWKKYLERNLNSNIAADEGASLGYYTVKVQFLVDREGAISNVIAIEVPAACPGCAVEAVRVIQKGPKWEPAVQNGRKVNYQAIQLVTFQVVE
jgi:protein TonB